MSGKKLEFVGGPIDGTKRDYEYPYKKFVEMCYTLPPECGIDEDRYALYILKNNDNGYVYYKYVKPILVCEEG